LLHIQQHFILIDWKYQMKISHLVAALLISAPLLAQAGSFTSTADGKAMSIPDDTFNTPAAKEFLSTGKNPYIGNADGVKAGKKVYQLYSCAQCHGPIGNGQVGPNLRDDTFQYAKNATDKGMFETIWGGSAGGMGAKGKGLMQPDDVSQGLTPDEVLKVSAFLRTKAEAKPAEAAPAAAAPVAEAAPAADSAAAAPAATTAETAVTPVKKSTKKVSSKKNRKVKKA
jgi:cytochrome c-L